MVAEISESDCCGNGCANCILDAKNSKQTINALLTDKENILQSYSTFQLIEKRHLLPNVLQMHFKCSTEKNNVALVIPPGHHVMMRARLDNGTNMVRPYSPYWADAERMEFQIIVNLKPEGPMSRHLREMLLNDEVEFRGPVGSFDVSAGGHQLLVLISQGVAVAPMMPIIEAILQNDDDMRRIVHFACFRDIESVCFRQQLHDYNKYWNYKGRVYLAHENEAELGKLMKYKEQLVAKRLTVQDIKDLSTGHCERMQILIAGTREFQDGFKAALKEIESFNENDVHLL